MRVPSLRSAFPFPLPALLLLAGALWLLWPRAAHAQDIWHVDDSTPDGLVAYWRFDEPGVATARETQNLLHATLVTGTMTAGPIPAVLNFTDLGVLSLDGNTNLVTVADTPILNNLTSSLTISAWVRRSRLNGGIDTIYVNGALANAWHLAIMGDHRLAFRIGTAASTTYSTTVASSAFFSQTTTYRHVAATVSGGQLKLYIDGQLDSTYNGVALPNPTSGTKFIGSQSATAARFPGIIDDLRLYNRALSAAEVLLLAQGKGCVTDGTTWDTAFRDLHCALAIATPGDDIWVGAGTYKPGTNPFVPYLLKNGVDILGGFTGTAGAKETSPVQRPVFDPNAPLTILSGDIRDNDAAVPFGAAGLYTDNSNTVVFADSGVSASVDGVRVHGGNARTGSGDGTRGGGLRALLGSSITLSNVSFFGNQATGVGGAVFTRAPLTLTNAAVVANRAAAGGGIMATAQLDNTVEPTIFVTGSLFESNSATTGSGGGMQTEQIAQFADTDFVRNVAQVGGGGLNADSPSGAAAAAGIVAADSLVAALAGDEGAVPVQPAAGVSVPAQLAISGGSFVENAATTGSGGGVRTVLPAAVTGSVFLSNTAQVDGGGIQAGSFLTVTTNQFVGNRAVRDGGGVRSGLVFTNEVATVSAGNLFQNNQAGRFGGGARLSGTSTGDRFLDNRAASEGAGLNARGTVTVTRGIFLRNRSELSGAIGAAGSPGVFPPTASLTVVNSLFAGSAITDTGFTGAADMRLFDVDVTLQHNTFGGPAAASGNKVSSILFRGDLEARNNIFAGYLLASQPGQTATVTLDTNVLFNTLSNFPLNPFLGITATNSITGDPAFADPAAFDFHIGVNSSARNTGLNLGVATDFEGDPRPVGPAPDIGFDEARFVAPTAVAGGPYSGVEGTPVALNATGSSDDGPLASFAWDCTDDGTIDAALATPAGAFCTYPDDGAFTLRLLVTDGVGEASSATAPVTIANVTPAVTPAAAQNASAGTAQSFAIGSFADPGADAPWQVTIDWGDGSADTVFDRNAPGAIPAQSHTYTTAGQRTVTAQVRDQDNATGSASFQVTVVSSGANVPPSARPGGPYTAVINVPLPLDGSASTDDGTIANYQWDCTNDGAFDASTPNATGATCTYAAEGTFTLRLRVTDNAGLTDEATTTVVVTELGEAAQYLPLIQK